MADPTAFIGNVPLSNFLSFIFLFLITIFFSNLISEFTRRFLKPRVKGSKYKIPSKLIQYLLIFSVTYYGLSNILGFDLTAFFAAFGIIGIAVAFSAQQTIQNIIAGLFIFGGGFIKLDDWIETGGLPSTEICQVKDIGLTRTTLRETNGRVVILPNADFITQKLVKYPNGDFFKICFDIEISSRANLKKAREIIVGICNKNEKILPNIPKKEKSGLRKLLKSLPEEHQSLLSFLQRRVDTKRFEPAVLTKEISGNTITLEIQIWMWEITRKDEIISGLMDKFLREFPRKGIRLV